MRIRTYSELKKFSTQEGRFRYLSLRAGVGITTFGVERYLNQQLYHSTQWKQIRQQVILRDNGCDLGLDGFEIYDTVYIHHMNPMTIRDVVEDRPENFDPEYLVAVTLRTHNAIHYGDVSSLLKPLVERRPGDTKLW